MNGWMVNNIKIKVVSNWGEIKDYCCELINTVWEWALLNTNWKRNIIKEVKMCDNEKFNWISLAEIFGRFIY